MSSDEIQIDFYDREDMSGHYVIDVLGQVAVPLLGRIDVAGLTAAKLEQVLLDAASEKGVVDNADVTVQVLHRADIFIDGQVAAPGPYTWRAGLTVAQATVLAGGRRNISLDEIGNVLTAYRSAETLSALTRRIAGLQTREVRLQAQSEMAYSAFGSVSSDNNVEHPSLDLTRLAIATSAPSAGLALATFAGLDITAKQVAWAKLADNPIMQLPAVIENDAELSDLRQTHQVQFHDWLTTNLAEYSSIQRQAGATTERLSALRARQTIVVGTIDALDARLKDVLILKEDGLMRNQDVLNAQTTLSSATSTHLEIVAAIANADVERYRQNLLFQSFNNSLQLILASQMEVVQLELLDAQGRLGAVRHAAVVSAPYLDGNEGQTSGTVNYELVRLPPYGSAPEVIARDTQLLPGDILIVSRAPD